MVYLTTHADLLQLVFPAKPLQNVLAAGGDWKKVGVDVAALLDSGNLGKSLFSFAAQNAIASDFKAEVMKNLDWLQEKGINPDNIEQCKLFMQDTVSSFKDLLVQSI